MTEKWLKIDKYFGYYSVSNMGRIRNNLTNRKLIPYLDRYFRISLYYRPVKVFLVHRLVAIHFIPNPKKLKEVNHKNGIKTNNNVSNLEWVDRNTNHKHAFMTGLYPIGSKHHRSVLDEQDIKGIRKEYAKKSTTLKALANKYGTTFSNISAIILRKSWKHL